MENTIQTQITTDLDKETPDRLHSLVLDLASNNVWNRVKARFAFIQRGEEAIPFLIGMLHTPNATLRWQIVQTLIEMHTPKSIPGLISALEDPVSSIRWLAQDGLVKLGAPVIMPLLNALTNSPDSDYLREGAREVFLALHKAQIYNRRVLPFRTLDN